MRKLGRETAVVCECHDGRKSPKIFQIPKLVLGGSEVHT